MDDRCCHRSLLCPCESEVINTMARVVLFCFCSLQSAGIQIMDIHMISSVSSCHGPQHYFQWKHRPCSSMWPAAAAIEHHYSPQQQHSPMSSSIRVQATGQTKDIHMDFGSNIGHEHPHRLLSQLRQVGT